MKVFALMYSFYNSNGLKYALLQTFASFLSWNSMRCLIADKAFQEFKLSI